MNKIFKVVWSKTKECYVVVSEVAKNNGGKKKVLATVFAALVATGSMLPDYVDAANNTSGGGVSSADASIAIGSGWGNSAYANTNFSIAIGDQSNANGKAAIALGRQAKTNGEEAAIAIGNQTEATSKDSTAVGSGSKSSGEYAAALGFQTKATANYATAIGSGARGYAEDSQAIGREAETSAGAFRAIAIGTLSKSSANYATSLGSSAEASAERAIAVGYKSKAKAESAISVGNLASADNTDSIAVGNGSAATANYAVAVGSGSAVSGLNGTAVGKNSQATGQSAAAFGDSAQATNAQATAIGNQAVASDTRTTAIGNQAKATGPNATVVGSVSEGTGPGATAIGTNNKAGYESAAVGLSNTVSGNTSAAFGRSNTVTGKESLAAGVRSTAAGEHNVAIGYQAATDGKATVAIGEGSKADIADGVALGSNSATTAAAGVQGFNPADSRTNTYSGLTGTAQTSTLGAVAVGNGATATRQITGLAAGKEDTDAVNVAQLRSVNLKYAGNSGDSDVRLENGTLNIKGKDLISTTANASGITVELTKGADIANDNGKAKEPTTNGVATTQNVVQAINNSYWKATAGGNTDGTPSVGNVKPGTQVTYSAGDNLKVKQTIAANGDQEYKYSLNADLKGINSISNTTTGPTMTFGSNSINITGGSLNMGNSKITNLAPGTDDKDAVNYSQIKGLRTEVVQGTGVTVAKTQGADGHDIYTVSANATGGTASTESVVKKAAASGDTNIADISVADNKNTGDAGAKYEVSVSRNAVKDAAREAVTINNGGTKSGTTYTPNADNPITVTPKEDAANHNTTYEVTFDGNKAAKQIPLTYKANGNGAKTVTLEKGLDFTNGTNTTAEIGNDGVVKYNLNKDVDLSDTGSLTVGGTTVNNGGITIKAPTTPGATTTDVKLTNTGLDNGGNKIVNVKDGDVSATSKDAVNGSQLHAVAAKERHIASTTATHPAYTVDNNGTVTMDYVDGDGNATSEKALITGVAKNDLSNITNAGKKEITKLGTIVKAGDNVNVSESSDATTGRTTYTVNAVTPAVYTKADGTKVVKRPDGTFTTNLDGAAGNDVDKDDVITSFMDGNGNTTGGNMVVNNVGSAIDKTGTSTGNAFLTKLDTAATNTPNAAVNVKDLKNTSDALINKGLNFTGNNDGTVNAHKLGSLVKVQGEGVAATAVPSFASAAGNIAVVADGTSTLELKLNKNLKGINSVNNGSTSITLNDAPNATTPAVTIKGGNLSMGDGTTNNKIVNLAPGTDNNDAVNVKQLKEAKTVVEAGTNVTVNKTTGANGEDVYTVSATGGGTGTASSWNVKSTGNTDPTSETAAKNISDGKTVEMAAGKNLTVKQTSDANGAKVEFALNKDLSNLDKVVVNGENGTNGKDGVTIIGPQGATGATGMPGTNGIDGKVGIAGKDGKDAVSISGKDGVGTIGLTGPQGPAGADGRGVDITTDHGTQTLNKPEANNGGKSERIVYVPKDKDGNPLKDDAGNTIKREVATMDDGLKFAGDDGQTNTNKVIAKQLNQQVDIIGGATGTLTDNNIGVNNDNGKLKVQLVKDVNLTNAGSLTTGDTTVNNGGITIKAPTTPGATTTDVKLTNTGLDNGGNKIVNVKDGDVSATSKDAVNGSQLHAVAAKERHIASTTATHPAYTVDNNGTVTMDYVDGDGNATSEKALITGVAKNDLSNITNAGKKEITKLGTIVKAGDNVNVSESSDATTGRTTYTVNAVTPAVYTKADGTKVVKRPDGTFTTNLDGAAGNDVDKDDVITSFMDGNGNTTGGNMVVNNVGSAIDKTGTSTGNAFLTKLDTAATNTPNAAVNVKDLKNTSDALINKGLNFTGNNDGTVNAHKLGSLVKVQGEGVAATAVPSFASAAGNIAVVADGTSTLELKLNKNLKGINSVNNGSTSITLNDAPNATTPAVTIKGGNLSMGDGTTNNKIVNLAPGTDNNDAVNVKQLKEAKTVVEAGTNVTVNKTTGANGEDVYTVSATGGGTGTASSWNVKSTGNTDPTSETAAKNISDGKTVEMAAGKNLTVKQTSDANGAKVEFALNKDLSNLDKVVVNGENGTNGKDGVTIIGPQGATGATGMPGTNGIDGKVGIAGKDGKDAVSISGKDGVGTIGLTGPQGPAGADGRGVDITTDHGTQTLNKPEANNGGKSERIVYVPKDKDGNPLKDDAGNTIKREVATMDDGLKFAGDDGQANQATNANVIKKQLNNVVDIIGGATKADLTTNNIGVNNDGNGKLLVQLSKNLNGINTIKNGGTTITLNDTPGGTNNTPAVTISGGNLSMGDSTTKNKIVNLAPGTDDNDAVNVKQLKDAKTVLADGKNTKKSGTGTATDPYKVNVEGDLTEITSITNKADASGNAGKITFSPNQTVTVDGDHSITLNASTGKIGGLQNKTFDPTNFTSGQAATEDQLKSVHDTLKANERHIAPTTVAAGSTENKGGTANAAGTANVYKYDAASKTVTLTYNDGNGNAVTATKAVIDLSNLSTGGTGASSWNVKSSANTTDGGAVDANHNANAQNIADGKSVEFQSGKNLVVKQTNDTTNGNAIVEFSLSDNITVGKDGANGKDGSVGAKGADGSAVVMNGKDGSIGLNGTNGANGISIKGKDGANGVGIDGKDGVTRIVYTEKVPDPANPGTTKEVTHEVATMDDGLKFTGNNTSTENKRKLGSLLKVQGEDVSAADEAAFQSAGGNIAVTANGSDTLTIRLNKNLKGLNSIQLGGNTIQSNGDNITFTTNGGTTKTVATTDQLWTIQANGTDVPAKSGKVNLVAGDHITITPDAANGKMTISATGFGSMDGFNVKTSAESATVGTHAGDTTQNIKNGKTVDMQAGKNLVVTQTNDGSGNTTVNYALNKDVDLGTNGSLKTGDTTINNDGFKNGNTTVGGNGMTIKDPTDPAKTVSLTKDGLNNGGNQITNVASGGNVDTNAANIGDIKRLAKDTRIKDGTYTVDNNGTVELTYVDGAGNQVKDASGNAITAKITGLTTLDSTRVNVAVNETGSGKAVGSKAAVKVTKGTEFVAGDNLIVERKANAGTDVDNSVVYSLNKDLKGIETIKNGNTTITLHNNPTTATDPTAVTITGGNINMGGNRIVNVAPAKDGTDAVNLDQLKAARTKVTSNDGTVTIRSTEDKTTGQMTYDLHVTPGQSPDLTRITNKVDQLGEEIGRVGAQGAALSALKPIQYDPLEPTQIMAGYGNYRGNSAVALGVAHYKNESTLIHGGVSWAGGSSHMMANAGVTWKVGNRDSEAAVADRYRKGPISSAYAMQQEMAAMKAQNAGLKGEVSDLKAENEQMKAQIAAMMAKLGL